MLVCILKRDPRKKEQQQETFETYTLAHRTDGLCSMIGDVSFVISHQDGPYPGHITYLSMLGTIKV